VISYLGKAGSSSAEGQHLGRIRQLLFDQPLVKGIGFVALGIPGNVLSGAYVFLER
jgi:hypothetical protein